jgi:hypothetical protein
LSTRTIFHEKEQREMLKHKEEKETESMGKTGREKKARES